MKLSKLALSVVIALGFASTSFAEGSSQTSLKKSAESFEKSSGKAFGKKVEFSPCGEECEQRLIAVKRTAGRIAKQLPVSKAEAEAFAEVIAEQKQLNPALAEYSDAVLAYEISLIQE